MKARRTVFLATLIVIYVLLNAAALFWLFTSRGSYVVWDIHPTLVAAQAVMEGVNPYSEEVTAEIQRQVYGRPAKPDEDVQAFAYPIYVAYLAVPLAVLPLPWAQAIWLTALMLAVMVGVAMVQSLWNWPRRLVGRGGLFAWCVVLYPVVWGFILGQIALLCFALIGLGVWAVSRGRDRTAGLALGLMWIKPQLAFLLFPGILSWAAFRRRWRMLAWGIGTFAALLVLPMLLQANWLGQFVQRLTEYDQYSPFTPPAVLLARACCGAVSNWLGPLFLCLFLVAAVWGWWRAVRSGSQEQLLWAVGMTLIATTAVAPQTSTVNQIILILPIIGLLGALSRRGRAGRAAVAGLLTLWGGLLWLLSWLPPIATATPRYPVEHRVLSPILPWTLAGLWLVAHRVLTREGNEIGLLKADRSEEQGNM